MNDFYRALGDIRNIRRQMAETTAFRGYGPLTLSATAGFALIGGGAQSHFIPDTTHHPSRYITLWSAVAFCSLLLMAISTKTRTRRHHSGLEQEMIRLAAEQFLPALIAGIALTLVLARCVPGSAWMLPGLWQILYALGVFSSCRFLPRALFAAGAWFLTTGLLCLSLADARALAPWTMTVSFTLGQLLIALILRITTAETTDQDA
ncbi:hypothetical protein ACFQBQ_14660 [Granulicella cerasi]|uniref:Uncharacterized protein n=1 Tax=Granulicella cerasi TaxID=741063 RepID=A0ABW1ZCD5_9BACT|nr:hypothetical protein [Granulicella cerasi]